MGVHRKPTNAVPAVAGAIVGAAVVLSAFLLFQPTNTVPSVASSPLNTITSAPLATTTPVATPLDTVSPLATTINGGDLHVDVGGVVRPGLWITEGGAKCVYTRDKWASEIPGTGGAPGSRVVVALRVGEGFGTRDCPAWKWLRY